MRCEDTHPSVPLALLAHHRRPGENTRGLSSSVQDLVSGTAITNNKQPERGTGAAAWATAREGEG
jgi:hypothetical protein